MTARLLTFIRLLRQHGVRVSVAESLDAMRSVSQVGVHDRECLRLGLRTALVKSHHDFATFDTLFARFFAAPRQRKRRRAQDRQSGGNGSAQRPMTQANGNLVRPPHQPTQRPTPPAATAPHAAQEETPNTADDSTMAQALMTLTDLEHAWQQQLENPPLLSPSESRTPGHHPATMRLDRDFPPTQLADMYGEVERLAARLLTRQALRYRRARHGRFDLRRTVLQGLRSGREVPFALAYRRRHVNKLRLIVLCDVSGSVWQVSTFLLKLVHTLQAEFTSVRSLVFVNSLVEVTELFRRMRFPQDLEALRRYPQLNLFGFSDFGRVFYQCYADLLGDLHRDTVLLILGDARTNHFDPQAWTLGEMRQRCRRLIWLNPEPRRAWNTEDSVMDVYTPYCDDVLECWTLEHLAQAADVLLQP
jgi:uncharacterized protein with von Willebrand factor type A (vWA) domain